MKHRYRRPQHPPCRESFAKVAAREGKVLPRQAIKSIRVTNDAVVLSFNFSSKRHE